MRTDAPPGGHFGRAFDSAIRQAQMRTVLSSRALLEKVKVAIPEASRGCSG